MVLLSVKSELKIFAELVLVDSTLKSIGQPLSLTSFALKNDFTFQHQINMVFEDRRRQLAIFVTESKHNITMDGDNLSNSVSVLKMVVGADGNLN